MSDNITVIHLRDSPLIGGVEVSLINWFRNFSADDVDLRLYVFSEAHEAHRPFVSQLEDHNIGYNIVPWGQYKNIFRALKYLINEIKKYPKAVIHTHDTRSDVVGIIAAKICHVPAISHNHAWHGATLKLKVLERIRTWVLPMFDLLLNVSDDTRDETIRRGLPVSKCKTIYTGIDLKDFTDSYDVAAIRSSYGYTDSDFIIGNLARLSVEKNQSLLIEMAAELIQDKPTLKLFIAGEGGERDNLQALVEKHGLERCVRIERFQKNLPEVLSMMDLFCLPSLAEGTPIVLYNAMAMRVPIVTSNVNGCSEIIENGRTGLIYDVRRPKDFIAKIREISEDDEQRNHLVTNAFAAVKNDYSIENSCHQLLDIYRDIFRIQRCP